MLLITNEMSLKEKYRSEMLLITKIDNKWNVIDNKWNTLKTKKLIQMKCYW